LFFFLLAITCLYSIGGLETVLAAAHLPPKQVAQCAQASHQRDIEQAQAARAPNNACPLTRCNVSRGDAQWQL
jgi:hypothetical protein